MNDLSALRLITVYPPTQRWDKGCASTTCNLNQIIVPCLVSTSTGVQFQTSAEISLFTPLILTESNLIQWVREAVSLGGKAAGA